MLVAGNMIGTGVFLLPVNLAQVGSIAIFGWVVATVGVAALGLVFAKLGELDPQPGGPYAYARDFLGPYAGFQTNYVYWFGNWIGNIAIAVAGVGYLAELIPGISSPPGSVVATLAVIWLFTFANILGPRVVGALQSWTVALGLIPILGIALFGWFWFDSANFTAGWNVSGESNMHAISRAASMALWAYMGIESAAVSAGVIENPSRNVPLATLMGLGLAAVVYLLSSTVLMGILPNDVLRASSAPFAEAARLALGTAGAIVISVCAVLKSFGTLGGWMLLVSQSGKAAADDGMFPRIFARLNAQRRAGRRLGHRRRVDDDRAVRDHVADLGRPVQQHGGSRRHVDHRAVCVRRGVGRESDRRPEAPGLDVHHLQMAGDRRRRVLPMGSHRRGSRHGRARDGGAAHQRAALSVLHPLDGGSGEAQGGGPSRAGPQSSQPPRNEHVHLPDKESCHATDYHARRSERRPPTNAGRRGRACAARATRVRPRGGGGAGAAGVAGGARLDAHLRRHGGRVQLRRFSLHGPEARATLGRSQRQLVRRVGQSRGRGGLHDGQLGAVLRCVHRCRRAHLWHGAVARRRRCQLVRRRGFQRRLALRQLARRQRELARLHGRPCSVSARPRHAALGRCVGRRQPRRLLDEPTPGVRDGRHRPIQARQSHRSRRSISTRTTCPRPTRRASCGE